MFKACISPIRYTRFLFWIVELLSFPWLWWPHHCTDIHLSHLFCCMPACINHDNNCENVTTQKRHRMSNFYLHEGLPFIKSLWCQWVNRIIYLSYVMSGTPPYGETCKRLCGPPSIHRIISNHGHAHLEPITGSTRLGYTLDGLPDDDQAHKHIAMI